MSYNENETETEPDLENFLTLQVAPSTDTKSKNFKARVARKIVEDKGFLDAEITAAHELASGNWSIEGTTRGNPPKPFGMLVHKNEVQRTVSQMLPPGDQPTRII